MSTEKQPVVVCALYKFVVLDDYQELRQPLLDEMQRLGVKGTLLLAKEGINGTVAGTREAIDGLLAYLNSDERIRGIDSKESLDDDMPFYRNKVKLKKEIVTMGVNGIDPKRIVGTYVKPKDWNSLISRDDVVLIDTRNDYEVQVGTFKGAIDPNTTTFREFPKYVKENLDPNKHKKVAMFCTGGIRCEKSTDSLKEHGFDEVYHLEEEAEGENMFGGVWFVFNNRVTFNHKLEKGIFDQCHACRRPITEEDKQHKHYEAGISCHFCYHEQTDEQRERFRERERQIQLARERGEIHIGDSIDEIIEKRRQEKLALKEAQRKAK